MSQLLQATESSQNVRNVQKIYEAYLEGFKKGTPLTGQALRKIRENPNLFVQVDEEEEKSDDESVSALSKEIKQESEPRVPTPPPASKAVGANPVVDPYYGLTKEEWNSLSKVQQLIHKNEWSISRNK